MLAPALLAVLAAAAWAAPAVESGLSADLAGEIARLESAAKRSETFRRLLAETDGVPRRVAGLLPPAFVEYERPPRDRLVFDPGRLREATEWEFQLGVSRELARAAMGLPIPVLEAELAAYIRELRFALELAAADGAFSRAWVERARKHKAQADGLRRLETWARSRVPGLAPDAATRAPDKELDRVALMAALLASGPDRFYAGAERALALPDDVVRLAELEDFLALHGERLRGLTVKPDEAYVLVDGRRYPAAVVRAAQIVVPVGGAERVKEAVGLLDADARELSVKLRRWLKWSTAD